MTDAMIEARLCRCGHDLRIHDPCSRCLCPAFAPGPARKYPARKG